MKNHITNDYYLGGGEGLPFQNGSYPHIIYRNTHEQTGTSFGQSLYCFDQSSSVRSQCKYVLVFMPLGVVQMYIV